MYCVELDGFLPIRVRANGSLAVQYVNVKSCCAFIPNIVMLETWMISPESPREFSPMLVSLPSLNRARIDTEPNQHMFGQSAGGQVA